MFKKETKRVSQVRVVAEHTEQAQADFWNELCTDRNEETGHIRPTEKENGEERKGEEKGGQAAG